MIVVALLDELNETSTPPELVAAENKQEYAKIDNNEWNLCPGILWTVLVFLGLLLFHKMRIK